MARALPTALHIARNLLSSADGWVMFVEIARPGGGYFRLCDNNRHLNGNAKVWQAASISLGLPEETMDGAMGELTLSVSNVSRIPMAYVETQSELLGQEVKVWLAHTGSLSTFSSALLWVHRGLKVVANATVMTLYCAHAGASMRIPSQRFTRANFPQLLPQGGVRAT